MTVQRQRFEPGSETGTDGQAPTALDKALLGGPPQRVGTFEYRYDTDTWTWSDTVARMHGYEPGQVEPTTELVLSHKHPDDLAKVKGLLKQSSAPFSSRHRIRTVNGDIRKVVVVGDAVTDADGQGGNALHQRRRWDWSRLGSTRGVRRRDPESSAASLALRRRSGPVRRREGGRLTGPSLSSAVQVRESG